MQSALFLDVVVTQCPPIFQLFPRKNKALLVGWNSLLILNLLLHVFNSITRLHIKCDGLASQCLHKYLHITHLLTLVKMENFQRWSLIGSFKSDDDDRFPRTVPQRSQDFGSRFRRRKDARNRELV